MSVSIGDVMRTVRNYFDTGYLDGSFSICNEVINCNCTSPYVCIQGSACHDGVFATAQAFDGNGMMLLNTDGSVCTSYPDEDFTGRVWFLSPPRDFIQLCKDIQEFEKKNPTGAFQSESFGGYSYTRPSNASSPWQVSFAGKLTPYRKMYTEVG